MNIPFLSKLTALLVIGGFCLSPLGLAGGGVVAGGIVLLLAGLNAAERGRVAQEGTAAGQMGALAQGLFSLTVWPFYLCVLGLLVWAVNDRETFSRPGTGPGARREVAGAPSSSGPKGAGRPVNLNAQPSPPPTGPLPKPRPLMSTLANRAGQPTGNGSPNPSPQTTGGPGLQRPTTRPLNPPQPTRTAFPANAGTQRPGGSPGAGQPASVAPRAKASGASPSSPGASSGTPAAGVSAPAAGDGDAAAAR